MGIKVAVFGVFDILHIGHIRFLKECKKLGDELVVVVARDSTVTKEKGQKPTLSENERLAMIESVGLVNTAILGLENADKLKVVERIKPDIIALGYNQKWNENELKKKLKKRGFNIKIVRMKKYADISSSTIKQLLKV